MKHLTRQALSPLWARHLQCQVFPRSPRVPFFCSSSTWIVSQVFLCFPYSFPSLYPPLLNRATLLQLPPASRPLAPIRSPLCSSTFAVSSRYLFVIASFPFCPGFVPFSISRRSRFEPFFFGLLLLLVSVSFLFSHRSIVVPISFALHPFLYRAVPVSFLFSSDSFSQTKRERRGTIAKRGGIGRRGALPS